MYIKFSSNIFSFSDLIDMPELNTKSICDTALTLTAVSMAYILIDEVVVNSPREQKMRNCMSWMTPLAKTNLMGSLLVVSGVGAYSTYKAIFN